MIIYYNLYNLYQPNQLGGLLKTPFMGIRVITTLEGGRLRLRLLVFVESVQEEASKMRYLEVDSTLSRDIDICTNQQGIIKGILS